MMLRRAFLFVLVLAGAVVAQGAPRVRIAPDRESGVYEPGQSVTWDVTVADAEMPLSGSIRYSVRKGGEVEIAAGTLELREGTAQITAKRDEPGVLLLQTWFKPENAREISTFCGAAFAPEKIAASAQVPDDFDEFWKAKIAELDAVPMNVQLQPIDVGDPKIEYVKITLDNIRGRRMYGQIARPVGGTNLPAALQVQWAGVYPLQRDYVIGRARQGWLAMNIIAHELPIDAPQAFYNQYAQGPLRDYSHLGNEDRETSYFLPMFLACRRAVDYLTQRPDWDKQTMLVHGGSQGGYQALVTAGLHPAVTAAAANVPAGCDHGGLSAGRSPGWPNWAASQGRDKEKMLNAARYFDAMNFATRIKCPVIVGVALGDTTCPPEGVFAAFNQIRSPKEIIIMPTADHSGDHRSYDRAAGAFFEKQKPKTSE